MASKNIHVNLDSLNENINSLEGLLKQIDKNRTSIKSLMNDVEMSGETVEALKALYAVSLKKTDSLEVLVNNTIAYLKNAENSYREEDAAISNNIKGEH